MERGRRCSGCPERGSPVPEPGPGAGAGCLGPRRVLLAASGSVAAQRLPKLTARLLGLGQVEVKVVTTEHAKHFYDSKDVPAKIYSDSDEWETSVVRAWNLKRPLLFCPAMNTVMWEHPITATQIQTLKSFGYIEVPCISKKLVCGDEGYGAMAEVSTIVDKVQECLEQSPQPLPS
uniref:phosphopantothenoylcysteine decarboxylase isoform X2 n=1 Tax=Pristiophorus japonicus TaxID=55135 RepID=UPI00398E3FDC